LQLAKALALRTHPLAYELIQVLLDLLQDEKWGKDAAKAFQTITSDDDLLNKSNHAVVRLLHKQRFFNFVFPTLVQNAKAVEDSGTTTSPLT
jgi:DNA repair/transcription protein MET18/MMS19